MSVHEQKHEKVDVLVCIWLDPKKKGFSWDNNGVKCNLMEVFNMSLFSHDNLNTKMFYSGPVVHMFIVVVLAP